MNMNILKQFRNISLVVATMLLVGCGGGGGGTSTPLETTSESVSGTVVDGPVYGATVRLYDISDTTFSNPLATTTTKEENGSVGDFNLSLSSIPEHYIIRVSGDTDTGADGVKNDNDEAINFEMTSVGEKDNNNTYVTPATTLVAQNVIDSNETNVTIKVAQAKADVKIALGLPDIDLTTTNPKKDKVATQAGIFVAQVVRTLPTQNKTNAIKSIAKVFKEDNKKVATIEDGNVEVNDLNLTAVIDDMNETDAQTKKEKIAKVESSIKSRIRSTVEKVKALDDSTDEEKKQAQAAISAINKIATKIENTADISELTAENIEQIAIKVEEGIKALLDANKTVTSSNVDVIGDVIEKNLDKNITDITTSLERIAEATNDILGTDASDDLKDVVSGMFTNIDIENSDSVTILENMANDSAAVEDLKTKTEALTSTEEKELFAQDVANAVENNETNITSALESASDKVEVVKAANIFDIITPLKDGNTTQKIAADILLQTVTYNNNQDINVTYEGLENLSESLLDHAYITETNLTKISALKFATYVVDLDDNSTIVDSDLVISFENNITDDLSETYDLAASLLCMKEQVIKRDTNNTLGALDVSICVNSRVREVVRVNTTLPLPPLSLHGITKPTLENNITLQY